MQKTILVVGGTGMLGEPVARRLKEDGVRVRIMARDRDKARKLFDESFGVIVGDVTDTNSLEKPLDGCFGVHINLSGEVEQAGVENVAVVASKKGLERISYISGATVCEENRWFPVINRKFLAEKAIRESGVPYSIFCPTWFMEALPRFVRGNRVTVLGKQPNPYHWVAADDYASMVSASYGLEEAANKRFFVHGPEALLMREALKRYCAVLHPDIEKVSAMPFWLVKIIATVTANKELKYASEVMSYFEKVGEGGDPTEANRILGAPATTLAEWLEKRKTKLGAPLGGVKRNIRPVSQLVVKCVSLGG